jgi:hypothetical protein
MWPLRCSVTPLRWFPRLRRISINAQQMAADPADGLEAPSWLPFRSTCFPSARGVCAEMHPVVLMMQALAKHVEQLVALPDELRETAICKYKLLCDRCGCHNGRELAAHLEGELQPRADQIARLIRACSSCSPDVWPTGCAHCSKDSAHMPTAWERILGCLEQRGIALKKTYYIVGRTYDIICRHTMSS